MRIGTLKDKLRGAREPLLWLLALGAAVITGIGARGYLRASEASARADVEQRFRSVPVVVARGDLAPGSALEPQVLAVRNMPADFLPSNSVRADHARDVLGRTVAHAVRAGEPIQTALLKSRADVAFAQRIALGRRAVTIAVDETAALAGLVRPGDRVDVRWRGGGAPLLNVPVLATGTQVAGSDADAHEREDYSTLTLELPEADARRLAEADATGLRVILRNPSDTGDAAIARTLAHPARPPVFVPLIVGGTGGPVPAVRLLGEGSR